MGIWARVDRVSRRCAASALALAMGWAAGPAWAESNGIAGHSGNPDPNHGSGATCSECHTGNPYTIAAAISGSTTVAPGATGVAYTISATGSATAFGFNVSATGGTLAANSSNGSRLTTAGTPNFDGIDGELTHISPKAAASWNFTWNAPSSVGVVTLYGCINPVDLSGTSDGDGLRSCGTLDVTVNRTPTAINDIVNLDEDSGQSADLNLRSNDSTGSGSTTDSGDSISIDRIDGSTSTTVDVGNGTVSRSGSVVRYTPDANFNGTETFTYRIIDSQGATATATVTVNVAAVNDPPTLNPITPASLSEDAGAQIATLSGIGSGASNESQTLTLDITDNTNPTLIPNPTIGYTSPNTTGTLSYTPAANQSGTATITVRVSDDGGTANGGVNQRTRNFVITVANGPDAPIAVDDDLPVVPTILREDQGPFTLDVLANDIDNDAGDTTKITAVTQGSAGGAVSISADVVDNTVTFAPDVNFDGVKTFTYTVTDSTGLTAVGNVSVTLSPVNDAPSIDTTAVTETDDAQPYQYDVGQTDVDDSTFTYALSGSVPTAGTPMTIDQDSGLITWTPPISPTLDDYTVGPITVTVTDSGGGEGAAAKLTDQQTFSIVVHAPDSDGDGMPDSYEIAEGFDKDDGTDGALDRDGDGRSNADEYRAGTDPDADDVVPVLDIPADVTVPSTGFLTAVDLGTATAGDVKDGPLSVQGPDPAGPFRPGRYTVAYRATDVAGNTTTATQQLDVLPRVEIGADQVSGEGRAISIPILLNGIAPQYPVTVSYSVGGTAGVADHDAIAGQVTIGSGTAGAITVNIAADGGGESDETLVLTLTNANGGVLGTRVAQTTRIVDRNVAPQVSLSIQQNGETRTLIAANQGPVSVAAVAVDPNTGDTVTRDFSGSDGALGAPAGNVPGFDFNPAALAPGSYRVRVVVRDAANAATTAEVLLRVVASAPALTAADTDDDGIADTVEGIADADGDGVPDYLDRYAETFVITAQGGAPATSPQLETESALGLRLGSTAIAAARSGASISAADIAAHGGSGGGPVSNGGDTFENVGGLFDFEITGLVPGGTASVVVPLQAALRPGAVWRKYASSSGWRDFVIDSSNRIASAPAHDGVCPAPGSVAYVADLNALHACVRLTLQDGGPNDTDGEANGRIRDPGGAAVAPAAPEEPLPTGKSGGGGAMGPTLLIGLLGLALSSVLQRRRRPLRRDGA